MSRVAAWILHPEAGPTAGPLETAVVAARARIAETHRRGFERAGADSVRVVARPQDDTPFGARLRALVEAERPDGVVVLGSGAIPLATSRDRHELVAVARIAGRVALANNRFSADVVAISRAGVLRELDDLATDNALPRWLAESARYDVADLRRRWRLAIDVDGPLDMVLLRADKELPPNAVAERLRAVARIAADPHAELLVEGRTSAETLAFLERAAAARVRALVEERGLRTADPAVNRRPPASVLGLLLDRDGPASLGEHLARLADAAVVDTRVLLAHRLGPDPGHWPSAEDRFASDLLLPERIADPWLLELTESARDAAIPVVLGGHTLVGPGLRLVVGSPRWS